ncbi:MAG: SRPBCC family protein [Oligoflexia bacterium]|nr:SRPBCC family protein [Oligoflexia bacterium]
MRTEISQFQNEYRLSTELTLNRELRTIFPFFAEARNLEQITPPFLHFEIADQSEIHMAAGTVINYALRIHGFPLTWRTLISAWEPPYLFVDEQLKGPYRYWIHRHSFEEKDGKTVVRDLVRYQVFGGKLLHELMVKRDLLNIFAFRQKKLLELFS